MKRFMVLAAAAAAIAFGTSAGNAADCVNGFLNVAGNSNIPCVVGGTSSAALNPDFNAMPSGAVIENEGPTTTGSVEPAINMDASPPTIAREPTSREDCQPGGFWLMQEPGGSGSGSILMACPAS